MMQKLITFSLILTLSFSAYSQVWKTYPYTPTGSLVSFSVDEGRHASEPVEWWYTAGHLVGATTGKHYSYMLTYFYFPYGSIDGFRILNISDDDAEVFYDDTQFLTYPIIASDKLDIQANLLSGTVETWKNKYDAATILPFEYEINASSPQLTISLEYDTHKHPLILGDDGYLEQGYTNYTYYYSQTGITATGSISFNGITENVTGTAWIDRQYGTLNPSDGTEYEWFSLQLSNGMDINMWNIFTDENTVPDDERFEILAAYIDETTQYTHSDFQLERLEFAFTPDNQRCYAQKWRLTSSINNLDLIISTLYSNSEVQQPFRFYEGATTVTGTVDGVSVTGYGFTELLHSYEAPDLTLSNDLTWYTTLPINWELNNPDDGNPLQYDLAYSLDNQTTYLPIVSELTDTTYTWSTSLFADGDTFWLQLTGYSIDGTLTTSVAKEFTYDSSLGLAEKQLASITIYPNPALETFSIHAENIKHIKVFNSKGILVKTVKKEQANIPIPIKNLSQGIYFVKVYTDIGVVTQKLLIK